ncbi:hypothetical protein B566_EDAN006110, partial [Ephemera danica]
MDINSRNVVPLCCGYISGVRFCQCLEHTMLKSSPDPYNAFSQFIGDWVLSDIYLDVENWPGSATCFKLNIYNATASGMNIMVKFKQGNKENQILNQTIQAAGDKLGEWTNTYGRR